MANDFAITHEMADLPPELWAYLKEHRFFAMIIKKEYGGLEFSAYAQARVLQKLAGVSGITAITVGVPNSLGPGELLQHYGTEEQKDHYLPRLARGQEIPCFALTSPEAGSDAGAIPDTGVVCMGEWQGQQVPGMRLTRTNVISPSRLSLRCWARPLSSLTLKDCWAVKKSWVLPVR